MTIFKQTLKRICSSKIKLAIIFLCPILFTAMFTTTVQSSLTMLVVDKDQSAVSAQLIAGLKGMGDKINVVISDEDEIDDKIVSYQADEAVIIEKGFEGAILSGETPVVQEFHILDKEAIMTANAYIDGFVSDMKAMASAADGDKTAFSTQIAGYEKERLAVWNSTGTDDGNTWTYGSLGFLVQFMLYMSIITAGIILEDRSTGVYYRTFFAPVTLKRYYAENLAAFLIIGVLQAAISITLLITVFGMNFGNPAAVYLLYAVFSLVCVAMGMWLITLFRKPIMAYLSILFITTPMVMLGGCYWPVSFMPDVIVKISKFFPTSWVMQAADKVVNQGANIAGIGVEMLLLLLFAGVFMAAGLVKKVDIAK